MMNTAAVYTYPSVNGGPAAALEDHRFHESQSVMISCGCVGVDVARGKIALLRDARAADRDNAHRSLPRGRKNMSEDLLIAALRESSEETGITYRALPLRIPTRATPPKPLSSSALSRSQGDGEYDMKKRKGDAMPSSSPSSSSSPVPATSAPLVNPEVTDTLHNCEPSSVVMYPYAGTDVWKMIFWFAASVDSTEEPAEGTREFWECDDVLEWVDIQDAPRLLSYEGDARAVCKVLQDMRNSGYVL